VRVLVDHADLAGPLGHFPNDDEIVVYTEETSNTPTIITTNASFYDILGIYENKAFVQTGDNGDAIYLSCIDLSSGEELYSIYGIVDQRAFSYGYLSFYDYETRSICLRDINNEPIIHDKKDYNISNISYEDKTFLAVRQVSSFDYSGYECAVMGFDGKMRTDWIRDADLVDNPVTSEFSGTLYVWDSLGEGIYYIGQKIHQSENYENIEYMLYDTTSGKLFGWPFDLNDIVENNGFDLAIKGDVANGRAPSIAGYYNGTTLCYTEESSYDKYGGTDSEFTFYAVDKMGNYKKIGEINAACDEIVYNKELNQYICVSRDGWYGDFSNVIFYNMNGNVIADLSKYSVVSYEIKNDCIGVVLNSLSGTGEDTFFTIIDFNGNMLFEPLICTDSEQNFVEGADLFSIYDNSTCISVVYNYNGEIISELPLFILEETTNVFDVEGYEFSDVNLYFPERMKIIGDYYISICENRCTLQQKGNRLPYADNAIGEVERLHHEESFIEKLSSSSFKNYKHHEKRSDTTYTISSENTNTIFCSSESENISEDTIYSDTSSSPKDNHTYEDLDILWDKWILDDESYIELSDGYYTSVYQEGPLRIDDYYFESGKLHVYFSVDPFDTGFVWSYYGIVDGNILELYSEIGEDYGYGAPDFYIREGTDVPSDFIHVPSEANTILCGYDYNGNELYIGSVVRIGANEDCSQYATGTIIGYSDFNYVQVKFTDVFYADEYGQTDYYYLDGLYDEITTYGEAVCFVDSTALQILIFG